MIILYVFMLTEDVNILGFQFTILILNRFVFLNLLLQHHNQLLFGKLTIGILNNWLFWLLSCLAFHFRFINLCYFGFNTDVTNGINFKVSKIKVDNRISFGQSIVSQEFSGPFLIHPESFFISNFLSKLDDLMERQPGLWLIAFFNTSQHFQLENVNLFLRDFFKRLQ